MSEQHDGPSPVIVFYSYAHEDERLRRKLETHLSLLRQQGLIIEWYDRQIVPGTDWASVLDTHLMTAQVILLLISPYFLASDYCYGVEMQRALARHTEGSAHVIPILLRPVDWESAPFASLQCLPRGGRPITQWKNQDEALVTVARDLRAVIEQGHSAATLPLSPALLTPRTPSLLKRQAQPITASADRNRQRLLKRVRDIRIQGQLERSLHHEALIALGLQDYPDALTNHWSLIVQETARPAHPLPSGTRITDVYDRADGELLILGEPGSGKTTLLLELARDLLDRAELNETHKMPVVFNLSTWAVKRQPLTDWLVEELNSGYEVSSQLAKSWLDTNCILPLLDGLDEVTPAHRGGCLEAIKTYRGEHNQIPLVVCSRREEYLSQTTRIQLHTAVMVQPLAVQQIDDYLESAGEQLTALRTILHQDEVLLELATNPLILNVLTLTYDGKAIKDLAINGSSDVPSRQIFAPYVQRMFERGRVETLYTQQQTIDWLKWLASRMAQHHQTEFYLENMQPEWLWEKRPRRYYEWTVGRPPHYIMWALPHAVYGGLLAVLVVILVSTLRAGISKEVLGALLGIFPVAVLISLDSGIWHGWRKGLYTAAVAIPTGALCGALISRVISVPDRPTMGLIVGLVTGGVIGLLASIIGKEGYSGISTGPVTTWKWEKVRRSFKRENKGLRAALVLGGVGCILVGAVVTVEKGVFSGLEMGGVTLLAGLLFGVLYSGVQNESLPEHARFAPNQRIWRSARKGLYFCLAIGSCAFIGVWLIISSVAGTALGWTCALIAGFLFGIREGWNRDWDACVRHLVLRVLLWRAGSLPGNYARFLDYADARILLRKIGGGYTFIHRLLLEYFAIAEMETKRALLVKPDATIYHNRGLVFDVFGKYEEAIKDYTRAIELDRKEVSFYRDRGLVYERRKEYRQAKEDYTSAIELDPKNAWTAWTYRQRGGVNHELEEYEKAIADFTQVIKLDPKRAFLYGERAWSYRCNKEYKEAIADYNSALELAPQAALFEERALVYVDLKEYKEAIADYNSALELNPHEARFFRDRGIAYVKLEDYENALADFTQAIKLEPERALTYRYRGWSYQNNEEYENALADFTYAIKLAPQEAWCYEDRSGIYMNLEEYEKAIADLSTAVELNPHEARFFRDRGIAYVKLEDYENALADFTQAIRLEPEKAGYYGYRGWAYYSNKEYENALADFTRALGLSSQTAWFSEERGLVYAELKEYEKAIADFTRAIELKPSDASLYSSRGSAFLYINAYEQTIADCTRAIELDATDRSAYFHRGYAYLWLKKGELAGADFAQRAALRPDSINAAWMIIYSNLGKQRPGFEITESLDRIVAINPQSEHAQLCQGVALGLRNSFSDGIAALERSIQSGQSVQEDAYFWKGLFCAYLGQETEATQAIMQALEARLPPVLLTPLYWLEQERPEMYQAVAVPFLVQYGV